MHDSSSACGAEAASAAALRDRRLDQTARESSLSQAEGAIERRTIRCCRCVERRLERRSTCRVDQVAGERKADAAAT